MGRGIRGWDVVAFHRWSGCEISGHRDAESMDMDGMRGEEEEVVAESEDGWADARSRGTGADADARAGHGGG